MKIKQATYTNLTFVVVITMVLLISTSAFASADAAKNKVKAVFGQIEASLVTLKQTQRLTKVNIRAVLTEYLLPEVETRYFTYKVLNKNLTKVPEALRESFVTELSLQLINTYSSLLNKYNNEQLYIGQSSLSPSGKMAMVDITIVGKTKSNKALVKLMQSNANDWLFFDIEVEGISLLQTKQGEINASFNRLGVDGTLLHLKNINQRVIEE
ncbi:ABC transporter substrate-binding protein [Colwellia sp. M166]|uniref:MlaC/ttg2D family ABC transporter substrate-binding protein n=1 Tax=Colwellia sp. M166 TaxID=2583805 RepID=UPI00211E84EB|nr:ABC transporter substrate-binding protein [Colwellia sp. M166]UUO22087.1 ABC transporter substrate-binding protein [Colwellia sp. M166]|tara:strand:- start:1526 stop:2161 length:636 start_codon:yes stop_codon:yes gene_type:complete